MKPRRQLTGRSNIADRNRSRNRVVRITHLSGASFRRTPATRLRRVLVPLDFSAPSLYALDYAVQRAKESGAAVILLHVLQLLFASGRLDGPHLRALRSEARRDFKHRLQTIAIRQAAAHVPLTPWLLEGNPAEVIVQAAAKAGADLIVMGSVGRKGVRRLLLGSVAERVVREADVPVTVVRKPPKRKRTSLRRIGFAPAA